MAPECPIGQKGGGASGYWVPNEGKNTELCVCVRRQFCGLLHPSQQSVIGPLG